VLAGVDDDGDETEDDDKGPSSLPCRCWSSPRAAPVVGGENNVNALQFGYHAWI